MGLLLPQIEAGSEGGAAGDLRRGGEGLTA
jgi:hypothetical protein